MQRRPEWTGDVVGRMHVLGITANQLAQEIGWNAKYLSAVLTGHRTPKHAAQILYDALVRLETATEKEQD